MKLLIASDIHGSAYYTRALMQRIESETPNRVLILGDILYHGPRNDLPRDYAPKEVAAMFNAIAPKLLCVRGNCDSEVDQMMLSFPILADYSLISDGELLMTATHGHHLENFANLAPGSVILYGHTHIPDNSVENGVRRINPGSVSIPKNGSRHSYLVCENGEFFRRDVESGETYESFTI